MPPRHGVHVFAARVVSVIAPSPQLISNMKVSVRSDRYRTEKIEQPGSVCILAPPCPLVPGCKKRLRRTAHQHSVIRTSCAEHHPSAELGLQQSESPQRISRFV